MIRDTFLHANYLNFLFVHLVAHLHILRFKNSLEKESFSLNESQNKQTVLKRYFSFYAFVAFIFPVDSF